MAVTSSSSSHPWKENLLQEMPKGGEVHKSTKYINNLKNNTNTIRETKECLITCMQDLD